MASSAVAPSDRSPGSRCGPPQPSEDRPRRRSTERRPSCRSAGWSPPSSAGWSPPSPGWILCAGLAVVGWLTADPGTLGEALERRAPGCGCWATAVGAPLGGLAVTLVPWGATARDRVHDRPVRRLRGASGPRRPAGRAVHAWPVVLTRDLPGPGAGHRGAGGPALAAIRCTGRPSSACLVAAAAVWGAAGPSASDSPTAGRPGRGPCRGPSWPPSWSWWSAGAGVLVTGLLIRHLDRIERLAPGAGPGLGGQHRAAAGAAGVAPNVIVWAASYALGAGFALGAGSVVAPAAHRARPAAGRAAARARCPRPARAAPIRSGGWPPASLAGAVAALVVVRSRPAARFDETSLVGGLAGVLAGAGVHRAGLG